MPIGAFKFFIRKRCTDNPENIFIALVLKWQNSVGHASKSLLSIDQVNEVAGTLSIFHARGFQRLESKFNKLILFCLRPAPTSKSIVNENHAFIQDYLTRNLRTNFEHFLHVLFSHNHSHFVNSDKAHKIVSLLFMKIC